MKCLRFLYNLWKIYSAGARMKLQIISLKSLFNDWFQNVCRVFLSIERNIPELETDRLLRVSSIIFYFM